MALESRDASCAATIAQHPNTAVSWFLMASYAYYVLDRPLLTDAGFDAVCRSLEQNWSRITHRHQKLVGYDPAKGRLTSGFHLRENQYPLIAISAARGLLDASGST